MHCDSISIPPTIRRTRTTGFRTANSSLKREKMRRPEERECSKELGRRGDRTEQEKPGVSQEQSQPRIFPVD